MNLWGFQKSFVGEAWDQFSDFLTDTVPEDPTKKEFYLPLVVIPPAEGEAGHGPGAPQQRQVVRRHLSGG